MIIRFLTIFPDYFISSLQVSILGRAQQKQLVTFEVVNLRDFTTDAHRTTDDRPFGGGAGMVVKVEPIARALEKYQAVKGQPNNLTILTSAKGQLFTQTQARDWSSLQSLHIICGHYEGVDERVAQHLVDLEVRIGDYVLTGGEPAAVVMADAVTRLLPGVLGNESSIQGESHEIPGQLGFPQYTRPEVFQGWSVPTVLLGGNHSAINAWRDEHRST